MKIVIYATSYLVTILLGHFFVRLILIRYRRNFSGGLKGAGALIGFLERVLTLTFVLLGDYTAIALVFAAKSIARYKKLEDQDFAEYYLIGTFASILFALLMGICTNWFIAPMK